MEILLHSKYYVYMHTFKTTNKSYIGYTGKSIADRLNGHYKNAFINNLDTHFYRALRKYGINDLTTVCLFETTDKQIALKMEKECICKYDTIKTGYNMAQGGTGGVTLQRGTESYDQWYRKKLEKVQGVNNPRYSGYTDEDIITHAVNLYKEHSCIYRPLWVKYAKMHRIPVSFSKMRFNGGGWAQFICMLKIALNKENIQYTDTNFKYTKTVEHKQKIGKISKKMRWYNNGSKNTRTTVEQAQILKLNLGRI